MKPSKRPAESTNIVPPGKKRGRPIKSDDVERHPAVRQAAKELVKSNEPIDASEIDDLVSFLHKQPDENWTDSPEK